MKHVVSSYDRVAPIYLKVALHLHPLNPPKIDVDAPSSFSKMLSRVTFSLARSRSRSESMRSSSPRGRCLEWPHGRGNMPEMATQGSGICPV